MPPTVLIRRNVISTRLPMATVSGSTSVISHRNRPPPSKSTTAATTGGESEYASRSTVNVAIVAGLLLAHVLASAAPEQLIAVVSLADGCDVTVWQTTGALAGRGSSDDRAEVVDDA